MMFSIIVPVYNSEKSLYATLRSVVAQTCNDYELIIVDDGSTDRSPSLLAEFALAHPDLSINIITQKNSGVSSARNLGMASACGEWIALLDSDDEWAHNKLERQLDIIKGNPAIDCLGTNRNNELYSRFFLRN